jgi:hypothetical protein
VIDYEAFIGPAVVAVASWAAVKVAIAKITQRFDDKEKADVIIQDERDKAAAVKDAALAASVAATASALQASVTATSSALATELAGRHQEYCRRFDQIEKKVGVQNGGAFVDREFCREVHRTFTVASSALESQVREAVEQGREAIRVGHDDREEIKQRLTTLEVTFEHHAHP